MPTVMERTSFSVEPPGNIMHPKSFLIIHELFLHPMRFIRHFTRLIHLLHLLLLSEHHNALYVVVAIRL